eukprot:g15937.t2
MRGKRTTLLSFEHRFNQPFTGVVWPVSLQQLSFDDHFNESITGVVSTASLQQLWFGFACLTGGVAAVGGAFCRWTKPRQAAPHKTAPLRAWLLLVVTAAAAVGADAAGAASVAAGDAFRPARIPPGGYDLVSGGAAELGPCALEVAACADDAECGGCSTVMMGWGWWEKTAELPDLGGGGGEWVDGGAGSSWDLLFNAATPTSRCEKVGAMVCIGFADAADAAAAAAAQREEGEEGLIISRRADSCLRNGMVQELLACSVRTVGCEPDDAPCMSPEKQRWGTTSSELAGVGKPPPSAGASAGAKEEVGADAFGPEWATSHRRRLATSSEASACDGIQSGDACCGETCGECGGSGCSGRGNGAEDCCTGNILDSGILCSDTGGAPPCILDNSGSDSDAIAGNTGDAIAGSTGDAIAGNARDTITGNTRHAIPGNACNTAAGSTGNIITGNTGDAIAGGTRNAVTGAAYAAGDGRSGHTDPHASGAANSSTGASYAGPRCPNPGTGHPGDAGAGHAGPDARRAANSTAGAPRAGHAVPYHAAPYYSVPYAIPYYAVPYYAVTNYAVTNFDVPYYDSTNRCSGGDGVLGTVDGVGGTIDRRPRVTGRTDHRSDGWAYDHSDLGVHCALPSAAPSSSPSEELGNASAAPTASPSAGLASSTAPTLTPTVGGTEGEDAFGFLGPGFMTGSFSADGVSDDVLASLGEDGVVRQVVCELDPCPGGPESVLVGDEAAAVQSSRVRIVKDTPGQTARRGERRRPRALRDGDVGSLRGRRRGPQSEINEEGDTGGVGRQGQGQGDGLLRRRLANIEEVDFSVPSEGGVEGEDGEAMTESQQAAAFINNLADPAVLAEIAAGLGVEVENLDFGGITFYQGSEFPIEKEFDGGSVELSSIRGIDDRVEDSDPSRVGTWVFALFLAVLLALAVACLCCCIERASPKKERVAVAWLDKPILKHLGGGSPIVSEIISERKLATIAEEDRGPEDVEEDEVDHEYDAAALASRSRRRWSGKRGARDGRPGKKKAGVPRRTESVDSFDVQAREQQQQRRRRELSREDSGDSKFKYDNPMHREEDVGYGRRYGDLAQHYDDSGSRYSSNDISPNLAAGNETGNPMYEQAAGRRQQPPPPPPPPPVQEHVDEHGQPCSESESEGELVEPEQQLPHRPVARIAIRAPPSYSRSFSEPDLSPVAEIDPRGRGESEHTSSTGGPSAMTGGSNATSRNRSRARRDGDRENYSGTDSGYEEGASDLRSSRGPSAAYSDSRGDDDGSNWTSARGTNSVYDSGRSTMKVVRPLKPLLGGGSPLSADSSWLMGSRSGSFASPAGQVHDKAARSMATLGASFSDSFSGNEKGSTSGARGRGRGGNRGGRGDGSDQNWRQGGEAPMRSHSTISSRSSSELLEEEGQLVGQNDTASDSDSRPPPHFRAGGRRPKQLASRNSLSASFSTVTTPRTADHQHDQQRSHRPSRTFPAMPEVANSRSDEGADDAEDIVANGGVGDDGRGGGGGGDVDAGGSGVTHTGGPGGSWAVDTLSNMSGSFTTESDIASSADPGAAFGDRTGLLSARVVESTPPASPSRQQFTTPDRINARIKTGEAAPIINADNTPNRNLRFSSAYREAVRRSASAGRLLAAKTGATPEAAAAAGSGRHSESAPELLEAAASEQAAAALKAHDDFTRAYSNSVHAGRGGGSSRSSGSGSETDGVGKEELRRQERSPSSAAVEIAAAASFSVKRLGVGVSPGPPPHTDGDKRSDGRSRERSREGGGGEPRQGSPPDSDEGRYGQIPALMEMDRDEAEIGDANGEVGGSSSSADAQAGGSREGDEVPPPMLKKDASLLSLYGKSRSASFASFASLASCSSGGGHSGSGGSSEAEPMMREGSARTLKQHLADPAKPLGSYRRARSTVSDASSDFTSESSGSKAAREANTVARMASHSSVESSISDVASAYSAASSQTSRHGSGRIPPPGGYHEGSASFGSGTDGGDGGRGGGGGSGLAEDRRR